MSRHPKPSAANQAAAREMIPAYARAVAQAHVAALDGFGVVARMSGEGSPGLGLDAFVGKRKKAPAATAAENDLLGVLILAGVARTTIARALGIRVETLVGKLAGTPAEWVDAELRRDPSALGGWTR